MNPIELAEQAANPWLFLAAALLLGALHGLEPGHSKGIMTAFMIGTRGTYFQAVVLALCATLSHTAVVWLLAVPASYSGLWWSSAQIGHYLNLISGIVILILAYWMLRRFNRVEHAHEDNHHGHDHDHPHGGHDHGHTHGHPAKTVTNQSTGADDFSAALLDEDDEHARHHMREVSERFSGQHVSTAQVAVFGLSTGLAPCSAAIVILITCLKLHQPWLGIALVAAFSLGLGVTLTSVALLASWGVRALGARSRALQELVRKAPFLSAIVTGAVGVYLIVQFIRSF